VLQLSRELCLEDRWRGVLVDEALLVAVRRLVSLVGRTQVHMRATFVNIHIPPAVCARWRSHQPMLRSHIAAWGRPRASHARRTVSPIPVIADSSIHLLVNVSRCRNVRVHAWFSHAAAGSQSHALLSLTPTLPLQSAQKQPRLLQKLEDRCALSRQHTSAALRLCHSHSSAVSPASMLHNSTQPLMHSCPSMQPWQNTLAR
jgi:hypothetical protein